MHDAKRKNISSALGGGGEEEDSVAKQQEEEEKRIKALMKGMASAGPDEVLIEEIFGTRCVLDISSEHQNIDVYS